MRERQLIADGGIKNCFQQASETVWKEVGKKGYRESRPAPCKSCRKSSRGEGCALEK